MRRGAGRVAWLAVWAAGALTAATGPAVGQQEGGGGDAVRPDPGWELRTLRGEPFRLGDLRGRPVFVNLWATWCPPCVAELASIDRLAAELGDAVTFLLVSPEEEEVVRDFARRQDLGVEPVLEGTMAPEDLGLEALPHTVILDASGALVLQHRGAADWSTPEVRDLLRGLAAAGGSATGAVEPTLALDRPAHADGPWRLEIGVPSGWSLYAPPSPLVELGLPLTASWLAGARRTAALLAGPAPIAETGAAGPTEVYRGRVEMRVAAPAGRVDALEVRWALCRADRCVPGTTVVAAPSRDEERPAQRRR